MAIHPNEQANRTRKAQAIADALQAAGCDADTAAYLTDEGWARAAAAAGQCPASTTTQAAVIAILTDREQAPSVTDLFASIAAGVR